MSTLTPSSNAPRLAVIMPTYRFDTIARQSIEAAIAMAGDDICVHFADNSENPEKHAYLRDLATRGRNVAVSCHVENIGAEGSWLELVRAQTAPLICMVADDDSFCAAYFAAALRLMVADEGCGAACGLLVSVADETRGDVPTLYSPPERTERDPIERIRRYTNQNAIAYAVMRTDLVKRFADYVEMSPIKGPFNDYLLAFHILSVGTFRVDRAGHVYLYDNNAWHLPAAAYKNRARFYVGCGLPEGFGHLERVHWAVANAHFFMSRFRAPDLDDDIAKRIAGFLFDRMIEDFRREQKAARSAIDALFEGHRDAAEALRDLSTTRFDGTSRIFDLLFRLMEPLSPEIAERHHAFLLDTFHPSAFAPPKARRRPFWSGFRKS